MNFSFDPDHLEFAAALRELLGKECSADQLRETAASETGRSADRWHRLAETGVVGATVSADHGGMGMDEIALTLLIEETGRAALPEPIVETTAVGVPLLNDVASDELQQRWLPAIARGDAVVTIGLEEGSPVADAHVADLLLLRAGDQLHAVERERTSLVPRPSLDRARRLFAVDWEPEAGTKLAQGDVVSRAVDAAFDRAALGAAAQLIGLAGRLIEYGAEYAQERHQFGKPIGSFQAVKHLLADALIGLEFARPVVYRAAWSVATDVPERLRDVSMAKAAASDAADRAGRAALQVHGAIGYTEEHDLHLWMLRARALASAWGNAAWHRARVGAAVLG